MSMSIKAKEHSSKEKRGTSLSNAPNTTLGSRTRRKSLPLSVDTTSSLSDKPIPNYLKPTISSSLEFSKFDKKNACEDAIKQTVIRRRSMDKPPSPSGLHKSLSRGPSERNIPSRTSSFSTRTSSLPKSQVKKPSLWRNKSEISQNSSITSEKHNKTPYWKKQASSKATRSAKASKGINATETGVESKQYEVKGSTSQKVEEIVKKESEVAVPYEPQNSEVHKDVDILDSKNLDSEELSESQNSEKVQEDVDTVVQEDLSASQGITDDEAEEKVHEEKTENKKEAEEENRNTELDSTADESKVVREIGEGPPADSDVDSNIVVTQDSKERTKIEEMMHHKDKGDDNSEDKSKLEEEMNEKNETIHGESKDGSELQDNVLAEDTFSEDSKGRNEVEERPGEKKASNKDSKDRKELEEEMLIDKETMNYLEDKNKLEETLDEKKNTSDLDDKNEVEGILCDKEIVNEGAENRHTLDKEMQGEGIDLEKDTEDRNKLESEIHCQGDDVNIDNEDTKTIENIEVEVESQNLKKKEAEDIVEEMKPEAANSKAKSQAGKEDYNDVIEETAGKLLEQRKNKVKALVGAFETVISLQEPET